MDRWVFAGNVVVDKSGELYLRVSEELDLVVKLESTFHELPHGGESLLPIDDCIFMELPCPSLGLLVFVQVQLGDAEAIDEGVDEKLFLVLIRP